MNYDIGWNLYRTVAPTVPVFTVEELKRQLHTEGDDGAQDSEFERFGLAAEQAVEGELSAAFLTQTWVLRLDCFPCWEIKLPRPPLQSVTSVQYLDADGATQVLATTEYTVDTPPANSDWSATPGRIHLAYGKSWPVTYDVPNAVTVTYIAGKATPTAIPAMVRTAIMMAAGDLHENRERSAVEIVQQLEMYERLVSNYRCVAEFRYA